MRKKVKNTELFLTTFIGEYVTILTKIKTTEAVSTEEGTVEQTVPLSFQGYVLDMDDEFYYIGDSASEVSRAISKKEVSLIEIAKQTTVYDEMLDSITEPTEEKDFN